MPESPMNLPLDLTAEWTKARRRIEQLKAELQARSRENEAIVSENLVQNEKLLQLNRSLEDKIAERTQELELSRQALEEKNRKLQELAESKDSLTHMIVHDMKNPLTAILGTLGLFRGPRFPMDPQPRELLASAHVHAVKLLCMVEEILTISRMRSKEFVIQAALSDLVNLIRQSLAMMSISKGQRNVTFRFDPREESLEAWMDYAMTERIVNNLLNNAIKYAPENSEIAVELTRDSAWAKVSVTNWGKPIPAEEQPKIFESFYRVKSDIGKIPGTGLGLTFCQLAVQAHGGSMGVVSPVPPQEQGACFYFTLPLQAPKEA